MRVATESKCIFRKKSSILFDRVLSNFESSWTLFFYNGSKIILVMKINVVRVHFCTEFTGDPWGKLAIPLSKFKGGRFFNFLIRPSRAGKTKIALG